MPPVATAKELGRRIKEIREAIRPEINQAEFGKRIGVSAATVSGWENKGEGLQKVVDFLKICRALERSPNEVLAVERLPQASGESAELAEFEDMIVHAAEVLLTEFHLVGTDDAHELGKAIVRAAKAKQAAGVDKPSAVRQVAKFIADSLTDQRKRRD